MFFQCGFECDFFNFNVQYIFKKIIFIFSDYSIVIVMNIFLNFEERNRCMSESRGGYFNFSFSWMLNKEGFVEL